MKGSPKLKLKLNTISEQLRVKTRTFLWLLLSHDREELSIEQWTQAKEIEEREIFQKSGNAIGYYTSLQYITYQKYAYWTNNDWSTYWPTLMETLTGYNLTQLERYGRVAYTFVELSHLKLIHIPTKEVSLINLLLHIHLKSDISAIFHQVDKCSIQYLYTHYLQIREWDKAYFYAEVLYRNGDIFTLLTIQNAHFFGLGRFKQDYVKAVEFGVSADLCRIGGFEPICIRIIIQWMPIRFGLSLRLVSKRWNHEIMTYCTAFWKKLGNPKASECISDAKRRKRRRISKREMKNL